MCPESCRGYLIDTFRGKRNKWKIRKGRTDRKKGGTTIIEEGWVGEGRMGWRREDGLEKEGWAGEGRMGWRMKDGMEKGGWVGEGRMGWRRKDGLEKE